MSNSQTYQKYKEGAMDFLKSTTPPQNLHEFKSELQQFLKDKSTQRVVLVTSGGTIVPLEQNMVRFLDNFSGGLRGAISAEEFLALGYAVIFLYREGSFAPFARHIKTSGLDLLQSMHINEYKEVVLDADKHSTVVAALEHYNKAVSAGLLLAAPYRTIEQYLFMLVEACAALQPLGPRAMLYSAAAVSDFYIPEKQRQTHKIQSADGPLELSLPQTPKMLAYIRHELLPLALCVSFKLETDTSILMSKARQAIEKYSMDVVVANELQTRHKEVTVVTERTARSIQKPQDTLETKGATLERELCQCLHDMHDLHIKTYVRNVDMRV